MDEKVIVDWNVLEILLFVTTFFWKNKFELSSSFDLFSLQTDRRMLHALESFRNLAGENNVSNVILTYFPHRFSVI